MASHHFETKKKTDAGIEDMFKRMYNQEFNEGPFPRSRSKRNEIRISWKDKRFLKLVDKLIKSIGDCHELHLPLRNDPKMTYNRMKHLKKARKKSNFLWSLQRIHGYFF